MKRINFLSLLSLLFLVSCSTNNNIKNFNYNHEKDVDNISYEMKVKIKDLFYEIKKYDLNYVAIDYNFKTYYDQYFFIDVRTFKDFNDGTGKDETGLCYEGFAFIDLNYAFTGLYDSKKQ